MLFKLLGAPITAPIAGFKSLLQLLQDEAERELYDEDRIREDLLLLQMRLAEGELDEDEYTRREAEILARLREARERRKARLSEEMSRSAVTYVVEGHADEG